MDNTEEELSNALKTAAVCRFRLQFLYPCRQLRPILQEIRKEKEGRCVLVIRSTNTGTLQGIPYPGHPTSSSLTPGKEAFRRQGFMPEAALLEELGKVGVS